MSQSNYIPWRGYFDLIASVDEFIFYDDVQYTKNDWRNRNRIKTPQGVQWLTVPVGSPKGRNICDVTIADPYCGQRHWASLNANYARASHFASVAEWLKPFFLEPWTSLSLLNQQLVARICHHLGIHTRLTRSCDYDAIGDRNGRLLQLCKEAGATTYVSGPAASAYLDVEIFEAAGVQVLWMNYEGYSTYPQLWGSFEPRVSIVDLLFNCGPDAPYHLKFTSI